MIILPAQIRDGRLLIEGANADDVLILSAHEADSDGFAILDKERTIYIVNTQPDLRRVMQKIGDLCDQVKAIGDQTIYIQGDGSKPMNPYQSAGDAAAGIKSELENMKLL